MDEPNSKPVRRYGEAIVQLDHPNGDTLIGVQFYYYPVDEPPVIEVGTVGRQWYRTVWESKGWVVNDS